MIDLLEIALNVLKMHVKHVSSIYQQIHTNLHISIYIYAMKESVISVLETYF
jgi:hypothetical protein